MMINLDFKKKEPIYEQIVSEIERYVSLGVFKPNEKVPSVRTLAMDLGINPNTVKKAYDILEEKKVIVTISTKGTFITDNIELVRKEKQQQLFKEMDSLVLEMEKLGLTKEDIVKYLKK